MQRATDEPVQSRSVPRVPLPLVRDGQNKLLANTCYSYVVLTFASSPSMQLLFRPL